MGGAGAYPCCAGGAATGFIGGGGGPYPLGEWLGIGGGGVGAGGAGGGGAVRVGAGGGAGAAAEGGRNGVLRFDIGLAVDAYGSASDPGGGAVCTWPGGRTLGARAVGADGETAGSMTTGAGGCGASGACELAAVGFGAGAPHAAQNFPDPMSDEPHFVHVTMRLGSHGPRP